jgi:topoisomerase-4 subunit A
MAYVNNLFELNFLEYSSYVVKERAIPHIDDGLKPVQRRILQSLFDVDDGKFHKVANIVGHCMQYHPHGDASIYEALVNLANKEILIDRQGNFGNIATGDPASAARYIECRILPLAKELLYGPEITEFTDTYDSRRKEPVTFPCKIPLLLVIGTEGIAVGMATKILPHNFIEVLNALKNCLQKKPFELFPDFFTGGLIDVQFYEDGNGKVLSRAKLDTSDPKRIVITELPFGTTTESIIASIESAARRNKIKIGTITDYTTDHVEIEIKMPRNVYTAEVVDGLFAFTECQNSISVNCLVIKDGKPVQMTVTGIIKYHAKQLVRILEKELKLEQRQLLDRLHIRTLERIFIEERIYKKIEQEKTQEGVTLAVRKGFEPFKAELLRPVTENDIEHLLKIPIRRISLYDINKMKEEMEQIKARLKEIEHHLSHLTAYAVSFIDSVLSREKKHHPRHTKIMSLERVDVREAAQRNLKLRYNGETGYLGWGVSGGEALFDVSVYDRVLIIRKDGSFSVTDAPEKILVGKGMLACVSAEKESLDKEVFSIIYRNTENKFPYIKRTQVTQFIKNKVYTLLPENSELIAFTGGDGMAARVHTRQKNLTGTSYEDFQLKPEQIKGLKTQGIRLLSKEFLKGEFVEWTGRKKKG